MKTFDLLSENHRTVLRQVLGNKPQGTMDIPEMRSRMALGAKLGVAPLGPCQLEDAEHELLLVSINTFPYQIVNALIPQLADALTAAK